MLAASREGGVGFELALVSARCTRPNYVLPLFSFGDSGRLQGLCHFGLPSIPSCIRRKNWSEPRDGFFKCPTFGFHVMCCMLSVSFSVCRSSDQAKNARGFYMLRSSYAVSPFGSLGSCASTWPQTQTGTTDSKLNCRFPSK